MGTPTIHRTPPKRVLALLQTARVCGRRNLTCVRARRFGYTRTWRRITESRRNRYAQAFPKRLQPPRWSLSTQKRVRWQGKTLQDCQRRAFSVDNTVDNPMLSPQIPVRPMRRSRSGFAQKRVRSLAESGSHVRRIEYGFAPQTQTRQGFAGRVYGLPVVNVRGIYDW